VIIIRYLAKEVFLTLIALTGILMLIFLSNQFVQYLNRAASGHIPGMVIMKLMMLEIPNLMGLLLPLGFYMSILLAYGRLYAENEMTVLRASGYGPNRLLTHSLLMATVVTLLVGVVMLWASPYISAERARVLRASGVKTLIQTIMPGRFHEINSGNQVFYVESMSRDHSKAEHVFLAKRSSLEDKKMQWDILWADKAFSEQDPLTGEEYVVLQNGKEYQGVPGQANYQVSEFAQYKSRLPHPTVKISDDLRTAKTASLWPLNNSNRAKAAELQWRFSIPIMVLTLTLVAVPLSRVNSRTGKFAKLLPAVVIYILYANFMFLARDATISGKIPLWIGMWWIHLLVMSLGLFLLWRNKVILG
jgi:lipopolysaccharide export system permease protein